MVTDESRIPVVVAAGQVAERHEVVSALDLAARAAEAALAGVGDLRRHVDRVSVVNMLSPAPPAVASALARRLGLSPSRAEVSTIGGNSPQWLVNRAASDIAAGEVDVVLIAGAEAQRSRQVAGAETARPSAEEDALAPDPVVGEDRPGVGPAELAAGMVAPVHIYAMFESVLAARAGRDLATHRRVLGELLAPFTEVAAGHPVAWFPQARGADELAEVGPDNRLVAEPYVKRMCAVFNVDQGAAVLVTSLAAARKAGLADDAVFCLSGADAADVWFPSARPDPGTSPAIAAAGRAALEAAAIALDDVGAFDLYSCFPCAVQMGASALGIGTDDRRGLTVTGGLPYFGGPGNNYTLHAIATMTDRLRQGGGIGLVTGLGWYATKHSVGVYSSEPSRHGWRTGDTSAAQRAIDESAVPVAEEAEGPAVVVSATVVMTPDGSPMAAPVVARLADGRHIAAAAHADEVSGLAGTNLVGAKIAVSGSPPRYRLAG
ncbi:MAG: acetyl-CoA acetyltransferase [Acidimicrobiales bacterium]